MHRIEFAETQFLGGFPVERFEYAFSIVDMTAYCSVPFPWLDVLVHRPFLQIKPSEPVHDVKMDHRVQRFCTAVAIFPSRPADDEAGRFHYRKPFLVGEIFFRGIYGIRRHHGRHILGVNQFQHIESVFMLLSYSRPGEGPLP